LKKKTIVLFVTLIAAIVLAACSKGPKLNTVDILDYVEVEFDGLDTIGELTYSIDHYAINLEILDVETDIELADKLSEIEEKNPELHEKLTNYQDFYEVSVDQEDNLVNGDTVTFKIEVSESIDFIEEGEKEFTVEGLEELKELTAEEVEKHVVVETYGANERGYVTTENIFKDDLSSLEFTVENNGELSNGDKVQLNLVEDESEEIPQLLRLGYELEENFNLEIEIEGLPVYAKEAEDIANLEDILRMIDEKVEADFGEDINDYDYEKEFAVYRQFDEEVEPTDSYWGGFDYDVSNFGSLIVFFTVTEYKFRSDEVREEFVVHYEYKNLALDEDNKANLSEMESGGGRYSRDRERSIKTLKQLHEADGYTIIEE